MSADEPGPEPRVDPEALFEAIPYARFLGIEFQLTGNEVTAKMPYREKLIGNPALPALHGGVTGAFLELTAAYQLMMLSPHPHLPKPVDISIDYLRSGRPIESYARATVFKHGRRVANVRAEAWQDDRRKPIAALHGHFLVSTG